MIVMYYIIIYLCKNTYQKSTFKKDIGKSDCKHHGLHFYIYYGDRISSLAIIEFRIVNIRWPLGNHHGILGLLKIL